MPLFTFSELEANQKIQLQTVAKSIKVHRKDADQQEELRGALKRVEAKRDAKADALKKVEIYRDVMATNQDIAVTTLQKLREQTIDRMNQSASISVGTMLCILKCYNPTLDTSVVTEGFGCSTEEATDII